MTDQLQNKIAPIIENLGVSLYDIETAKEYDRTIFRVYITSPQGISLDQCEEVSRIISPILDLEEPVRGNYFFEVSSPGIERPLKKLSHFEQSIGEKCKLKTSAGETHLGTIQSVDGQRITLNTPDGPIEVELPDLKSARTYFEWESSS